jgi:hypothetical protein
MLRVGEIMEDYRFYWRNPSVVAELPKEQRKRIIEKFLELLEKDKEKNTEWRSKFMKERNQKLPQACGRGA